MNNFIDKIINNFKESTFDDPTRFPGYNYTAEGQNVESLSDAQLTIHYMGLKRLFNESYMEEIDINHSITKVRNLLMERYRINNSCIWPYQYSPYFTDNEAEIFAGYYDEAYSYRQGSRHNADFRRLPPQDFRNKVKEIQQNIEASEDPDEISHLKNELIGLGWNPEIKYDDATQVKAQQRIVDKYDEELHEVFFLDCTKDVDTYKNFILPYGESMSKYNISPVHLFIYDDGSYNINTENTIESIDESHTNIDLYTVFIKDLNKMNYNELTINTGGAVFTLPSNVIAARLIKNIYEMNTIGIGGGNKLPLVKKIYSGSPNKFNKDKINEFLTQISSRYGTTEPVMEDGIIPFKDYYSLNLL